MENPEYNKTVAAIFEQMVDGQIDVLDDKTLQEWTNQIEHNKPPLGGYEQMKSNLNAYFGQTFLLNRFLRKVVGVEGPFTKTNDTEMLAARLLWQTRLQRTEALQEKIEALIKKVEKRLESKN